MNTITWYAKTVGSDSTNGVATKAGLTTTTLGRQLEKGRLTPETVVAIANAYGTDVLDALVIAGLVTREHIRAHGVRAALAAATDEEIADEVYARLTRGDEHKAFDEPVGRVRHMRSVPTPMSDVDDTLAARDVDDDAEAEAQTEDA